MAFVERYLVSFSPNFQLAVLLWPILAALLTVPLLAYLYHRDGRLCFVHIVAVYLAVLYAIGIACFTLYPLPDESKGGVGIDYGIPWQLDPLRFIKDFQTEGWHSVPQLAFNVAFFVPLGFIAGRLLNLSFPKSLVLGLCCSALIEVTQGTGIYGIYKYSYRTADVNDLMTNTLGACIGWWLASLLARVLPPGALAERDEVSVRPGFVRRSVAFAVDMTVVGLGVLVVCGVYGYVRAGGLNEHWQDYYHEIRIYVLAALFVLVEGVLPALHKGMTLGGGFVRMSFETKDRDGAMRGLFYVLRLAVLGSVVLYEPFIAVYVLVFYLFARRMPYDFLPGDKYPGDTIEIAQLELKPAEKAERLQ